jgi:capsular polysaccharide biosynthesis protein
MVRLPPRLRPLFPLLKPAYVATTRALAPTTTLLSRARGGWLPTGSVASMEDAAASTGGRCVVVREPEVLQRPAMLGAPPGTPLAAGSGEGEHVGRVAVAELPHARVLGPHRAIITARNELLHELSWYFGTSRSREHPLYLNPFPPAPLEMPGRLGLLAARGDGNYYHFLHDVVPRLGLLEQAPDVAPVDHWYVPVHTPFQRELLDLLDVPAAMRIDATQHPHVRAECLVVPGVPAMIEKNPPWVSQFLRDRLLAKVGPVDAGAPIFVTRGPSANNRTVVNEADVIELLVARGFVAIDPGAMSVVDQIRAFAAAPVIVAPHGAALANIAFARPGAAVIELFPAGSLLPDFWRMACGVPGVQYRYLSATGGPARPTRARTIVLDITVDLAALARLLDEVADR